MQQTRLATPGRGRKGILAPDELFDTLPAPTQPTNRLTLPGERVRCLGDVARLTRAQHEVVIHAIHTAQRSQQVIGVLPRAAGRLPEREAV